MNTAVLITLIVCGTITAIVAIILIAAAIFAKKQARVMKDAQNEFDKFFKED